MINQMDRSHISMINFPIIYIIPINIDLSHDVPIVDISPLMSRPANRYPHRLASCCRTPGQ